MELGCAIVFALVSLVAATPSPYGYGVKGGAAAKAEASAGAFSGLGTLPVPIPSGAGGFSSSFSKSSASSFASSSASSSASSFSFSGSGAGGLTGVGGGTGTSIHGGCETTNCQNNNGLNSAPHVPEGGNLQTYSGANALSGTNVFAEAPDSFKNGNTVPCNDSDCLPKTPECEGSNCDGSNFDAKCIPGQCKSPSPSGLGYGSKTSSDADDSSNHEKSASYNNNAPDCAYGKCGTAEPQNIRPSHSNPNLNGNPKCNVPNCEDDSYNPNTVSFSDTTTLAHGTHVPVTYLTTPKESKSDVTCTSSSCQIPDYNLYPGSEGLPSSYNVPSHSVYADLRPTDTTLICSSGKCDNNNDLPSNDNSGLLCTSSNCRSNSFDINVKKTTSRPQPPQAPNPFHSGPIGSVPCTSGNCAGYPSSTFGSKLPSDSQTGKFFDYNNKQSPNYNNASPSIYNIASSQSDQHRVPSYVTTSTASSSYQPLSSSSPSYYTPSTSDSSYHPPTANTPGYHMPSSGVPSYHTPPTSSPSHHASTSGSSYHTPSISASRYHTPTLTSPNYHLPSAVNPSYPTSSASGSNYLTPSKASPGYETEPVGGPSYQTSYSGGSNYHVPSAGIPSYQTPSASGPTYTPSVYRPYNNSPTPGKSTAAAQSGTIFSPLASDTKPLNGGAYNPQQTSPSNAPSTSSSGSNVYSSANSAAVGGSSYGLPKPGSGDTSIHKKPAIYTGGFGGPPGLLNPDDFTSPTKPVLAQQRPFIQQPYSTTTRPVIPSGTQSPGSCTSGNCASNSPSTSHGLNGVNNAVTYSGGFGGPPGFLKPYTPVSSEQVTPHYSQTGISKAVNTGASASSNAVAYNGGFGGPPGLLKPYDNGGSSHSGSRGKSTTHYGSAPNGFGNALGGGGLGAHTGAAVQASAFAGAGGSGAIDAHNQSGTIHNKNYNNDVDNASGGCKEGCGGDSNIGVLYPSGNTGGEAEASAFAQAGASAGTNTGGYNGGLNHHGCKEGCGSNSNDGHYGQNQSYGLTKGGSFEGLGNAGASAKSIAGANAGSFGLGGSFASSSASAHASVGTKGGYGK